MILFQILFARSLSQAFCFLPKDKTFLTLCWPLFRFVPTHSQFLLIAPFIIVFQDLLQTVLKVSEEWKWETWKLTWRCLPKVFQKESDIKETYIVHNSNDKICFVIYCWEYGRNVLDYCHSKINYECSQPWIKLAYVITIKSEMKTFRRMKYLKLRYFDQYSLIFK